MMEIGLYPDPFKIDSNSFPFQFTLTFYAKTLCGRNPGLAELAVNGCSCHLAESYPYIGRPKVRYIRNAKRRERERREEGEQDEKDPDAFIPGFRLFPGRNSGYIRILPVQCEPIQGNNEERQVS